MGRFRDLTGMTFGRWTVLGIAFRKNGKIFWECQCSCIDKKIKNIYGHTLTKGESVSCGCFRKEETSRQKKKYNEYVFYEDHIEIILSNSDKRIIIDIEDYDKLKNYCWYLTKMGYAYSHKGRKNISLHSVLFGREDLVKNNDVDHEDKNPLNCRRSNLRICTHADNSKNRGLQSNNTSGVTGVCWDKRIDAWSANLICNKVKHFLGNFNNFENAVIARLKAEKEYFKEFAPQKHLYEKYGIE